MSRREEFHNGADFTEKDADGNTTHRNAVDAITPEMLAEEKRASQSEQYDW